MRVVSLVPSWTETLLEAGVDVVGRTRFCIHPKGRVEGIARVGGTKDWDFPRVVSLKPDLLVLDREENPKFMSEQASIPWVATHVDSVEAVPAALKQLSGKTGSRELLEIGERWKRQLEMPKRSLSCGVKLGSDGMSDPPALFEWGRKPARASSVEGGVGITQVLYMIWKDPWMCVSRDTFIGSVLDRFGWGERIPKFPTKYPEIDLKKYDPKETLLLFSSEPYPFLKKRTELDGLGFPYAFVDGESLSWFGIRALNFLEKEFK